MWTKKTKNKYENIKIAIHCDSSLMDTRYSNKQTDKQNVLPDMLHLFSIFGNRIKNKEFIQWKKIWHYHIDILITMKTERIHMNSAQNLCLVMTHIFWIIRKSNFFKKNRKENALTQTLTDWLTDYWHKVMMFVFFFSFSFLFYFYFPEESFQMRQTIAVIDIIATKHRHTHTEYWRKLKNKRKKRKQKKNSWHYETLWAQIKKKKREMNVAEFFFHHHSLLFVKKNCQISWNLLQQNIWIAILLFSIFFSIPF